MFDHNKMKGDREKIKFGPCIQNVKNPNQPLYYMQEGMKSESYSNDSDDNEITMFEDSVPN